MYEVIKEFAGIKKGEKLNFTKHDAAYLQGAGYITPIEPEVKSRKKKIDKTKLQTK